MFPNLLLDQLLLLIKHRGFYLCEKVLIIVSRSVFSFYLHLTLHHEQPVTSHMHRIHVSSQMNNDFIIPWTWTTYDYNLAVLYMSEVVHSFLDYWMYLLVTGCNSLLLLTPICFLILLFDSSFYQSWLHLNTNDQYRY